MQDPKNPCSAQRLPVGVIMPLLACTLVAVLGVAAGSGYVRIPFGDVFWIIAAKATGNEGMISHMSDLAPVVVVDVRLPRILTAAFVGGGLAMAGVVFQGILINPLADPYTLGVSAGAAFGASLALLLNVSFLGLWSVPAFAFTGALLTLGAVIFLSATSGDIHSESLILSGIIVAAILSAGVSFIKYLADDAVSIIIFWLMGSFVSKSWTDVGLTALTTALGLSVSIYFSRDLNVLALGHRTAGSLGVSPRRICLLLLVTASLISAVCVAVSGIIGFVGLLVPHIVRLITGPDNRKLIPVSMLAGSLLLLCADTVSRAFLPHEVPIGVITALVGGPFFCYVYRKRQIRQNP